MVSTKRSSRNLKALLREDANHKAAVQLDAEVAIELTDEQRDILLHFVEANKRFPNAIELNLERQLQGTVRRSTLFPVTMLVGAMA